MDSRKEIEIEIAKNRADEIVSRRELDAEKKKMIDKMLNGMGDEIRKTSGDIPKPVKIRKPFTVRLWEFFNKINRIFGK